MSGIETFLKLLEGQQGAAPTPMANIQRPYQLPGGRTPPMALSGLQKAQAAQLARGTGGPAPRVLPMLANVAQGKYISPLQKALMKQEAEQPIVDTSAALQGAGAPAATTFGQRYAQPTTQALLGAAIQGADASGWSPVPVSTGQVLARMGAGAMRGYEAGKKAELEEAARKAAADKAAFDRRLQMAQFYQREREISGVKSKEAKANEINQVKLERDLRKDFETYSKPFTEAQRFFKDVINFSGEDNTSAQDLALVFSYMKLLDPGSVVREGEQYQVRDLGSIPDSFRVMLSRYGFFQDPNSPEGKMLLPQSVRNSIREASMEKYSDSLGGQLEVENEYSGYGKRADLNKNYFRPKIQQNGSIKSPYLVNSVEEGEAKAKSGEYFVVSGDGFYRKD